jgi:hypothetical protein
MANQIIAENQLSGTSASVWDIGIGGGSNTIEGFATDISVNRGQTVSFKINTVATKYSSGSITGWSYNWSPALTGSYTLVSRAIDDSLNIGANSKAVAVTVTASPSVSLFAGSTPRTVSANDPNAIEIGVRFQSSKLGRLPLSAFIKAL